MLPVPPPRTLARAVVCLLAVDAVISATSIALNLHALSLVAGVEANPGSISSSALDASDRSVGLTNMAGLVGLVATAAAFITWLFRSAVFQEQTLLLGVGHSRGWAIGSWFVPILNLHRPKKIVDAVWRGPSIIVNDGLARPLTVTNWWWATWLISNVLARLSTAGEGTSLAAYHRQTTIGIASDAISIVAAVLAVVVVRTITQLQTQAELIARTGRYSERAYVGQVPNPWQHIYPVPADLLNSHRAPASPTTSWLPAQSSPAQASPASAPPSPAAIGEDPTGS